MGIQLAKNCIQLHSVYVHAMYEVKFLCMYSVTSTPNTALPTGSQYCPYPPCQLTLLQCSFQILAYLKSSHSRCVDKNVNILLLFTANTVNTVTTAISVNSTFCVLTCGKYHNCIHDMPSVTKLCFPNYFIQHGVTLLTIHKTYDHTL